MAPLRFIWARLFACGSAALLISGSLLAQAQSPGTLLWQIGQADHDDSEFALGPGGFAQFREDGFFVVGRSDARRDWPYVHPGPADAWAGGRPHTFSIVFGLKSAPAAGECRLRVQLVDTHSKGPPELQIAINGLESKHRMPAGAGDDSLRGQPAKGREHKFEVAFPASTLKAGLNEIGITTLSGSWVLYDWIGLEAPAGTELAPVTGTSISSLSAPPLLFERDGKLMQSIRLAVRHFGDAAEARVLVDGATVTNLPLRAASQTLELSVPAVEKEKKLAVSVEIGGQTVARQPLALKPVRKWVVYLLPHSHVDIGYTHVQTDVEHRQWRNLELAIEAARKSADYPPGARFKWNTEVLWAVDSYLRQATFDQEKDFMDAVQAGWIGLDALYGNELTGLCRPEELLRLVGFATRLGRRTGVPIESAMISDVPGYTWGIVPAFAQSGVKYFSMGPNRGDRIGHTLAAWGDKPFWWLAPDGKDKVLAWMAGQGYHRVFSSPQSLLDHLAHLEATGYPYDMVQVRHCLGDNSQPDVSLADTVKQWNEAHAYPKLVIATTAEMFHEFEKRYGDKLPRVKGDFTPYWEDGAASSARETALNRAAADRLTQAETLFAMLQPKNYPAEEFYQAWRNVVLYDEHTWGAHNSISAPDAPFVKSQWAIKQAFALDADKQSRALLAQALGAAVLGDKVGAVTVFNTTSWPRTDLAVLSAEQPRLGDVVTAANAEPVPAQRLATGELVFLAKQVPPFGARQYSLKAAGASKPDKAGPPAAARGATAQGLTLSTSTLSLRLDQHTGAIVSLRGQNLEADLVDTQAPTALNDYFYLPGSDVRGLKRNGPVKISVKERGPLVASLLVEGDAPGCRKLTREVRVIEGLDRVDITDTVDKLPVRAKEGVHFGFAFNVPDGVMRMDMPWAVVRPETDQIPGACKNWLAVQRWVDISNPDYGVTWATLDAPLVEVGAITANLIGSLSDPRLWLDHLAPSQTFYSWVMNNHWHTNYRAEQEGPTVFRYCLWPHRAFRAEAAARFGVDCSQPLVVAPARGNAALVPRLRVEPAGVVVTAFKPSDDGEAWILRLFGASGRREQAKITWAAPAPRQVWLSDASEQRRGPAPGSVEVPGYGIVTLRAELP